jgi:predicted metal-dependent HD superfamily phosphohydrolase
MTGDELAGSLAERWALLAGSGPAAVAAAEALLRRYAEPHRRYHDTRHLGEVLDRVDELAGYAREPDLVRLAAWFHDAVYDPTRADNEEQSAALAEQVLPGLGLAAASVTEVARLVRLTAGHSPAEGDRNGAVLCDADLAILAATPARYAAYAAAVRAEYRHVDDAAFAAGRAAVLRHLLGMPVLFRTAVGRERYEARARHNLATELSLLGISAGAGPPP